MPPDVFRAFELDEYEVSCEAIKEEKLDVFVCKTQSGGSVLHLAAFFGQFTVVWFYPSELLIEEDENGDFALIIASRRGHFKFVEDLIKKARRLRVQQADVGEAGSSTFTSVQKLLRMANKVGNTAVPEAVKFNHKPIVSFLVKEDPSTTYSCNVYGESPLYIAAEQSHTRIAKTMIKHCFELAFRGPNDATALHVASCYNNHMIVNLLLNRDIDISLAHDKHGWTALHYATLRGLDSTVQLLVSFQKTVIYRKDINGVTPLHIACSKGFLGLLKFLIHEAPDARFAVDSQGRNIIHYFVLHSQK